MATEQDHSGWRGSDGAPHARPSTGAVTWTMQVPARRRGYRPLDVVFFPSANVNAGVRLVGNPRYPPHRRGLRAQLRDLEEPAMRRVPRRSRPLLRLRGKRKRQQAGATENPFVDPDGYRAFIAEAEARFRNQLTSER